MSIHGHSSSRSTPQFVRGLHLPSSSTHAGPYQLPLDDPFVGSSAQRPSGGARHGLFDDEGEYFQDDMIFEFDDNGEMRDIDENERKARMSGRVQRARLGSDSAGSGRVRREHEGATSGQIMPAIDAEGDFDMANYYEDGVQEVPNDEPLPMMSGALGSNDRPHHLHDASVDHVYDEHPSVLVVSSDAPLMTRKARTRKAMAADRIVEFRNTDLIQWQAEYNSNMAAATLLVNQRKAQAQAKKNAFWFVCGTGLNGIGYGVGSLKVPSPLEMFMGETLLSKITGKSSPSVVSKSNKTKRARDIDMEEQVTPKRARRTEPGSEVGRGYFEDDQEIMIMEDGGMEMEMEMEMEVGREAPSALPDRPSSTIMPWNVSAPLTSHQKGASSSHHRGAGSIGRRHLSASPLVGRGSALPGPLEQFSMQEDEIMDAQQAEFEIFGPAAQVDTQTAAESQWMRETLAREAGNFLEYVVNTISEKAIDELEGDEEHAEVAERDKFVTFEELFDPEQNSQIVAAQAFYHVLTLATKGRIWVTQDITMELSGPIQIGVMS